MYHVSIVRCNSYENKEVNQALQRGLADINFKFKKNMKVLIKPNILSPNKPEAAITTHPTVIEELCKILKKFGAEIYIGESSSYDTNLGFKVSGIAKLKKYAKIINFETVDKDVFDFKTLKQVPLPKILNEVDLVIDVAKLKTHVLTGVTLCVKNLYGCIPGKLKSSYHKDLMPLGIFAKFLLELNEKIKPKLNIIDGIVGLEGDGPGAMGKPIESKLIIIGDNAIAADIVASRIIGFDSYSIYTNKLSNVKKEDIQIIGNKATKLNFKKPNLAFTSLAPFFNIIKGFFPEPKIRFNHEKCKRCGICEKNCPVKAISLSPYPKSDDKCIRCCCCIEVCPHKAINLKEHFSKKWAKKVYGKISRQK